MKTQMCLSVFILGVRMMIFLPRGSVQQEAWNKLEWLKCKFVFTEGYHLLRKSHVMPAKILFTPGMETIVVY